MTRAFSITLFAIVVLAGINCSAQNEWPQFRGPNSSGLGVGKAPVGFGPDQNVRWKTAVGAGLSSPTVWRDRIFLTEFDAAKKQLATLGIDRRSGKKIG